MTADGGAGRDVQILLSCYNGRAFLPAQLDSLRAQTVAPRVRVLVRDDGSTDGSADLVRGSDPGELVIEVVDGTNVGAIASFADLMRRADRACGVFLFCDQDDVWLPDKVECAIRALGDAVASDVPTLVAGRSFVVDEALRPIGVTDDAPKGPSLHNALTQNIAPGHAMAFNRALLDAAGPSLRPGEVMMHDCWLYIVACALGHLIWDPVPHARYRLHPGNEAGYQTTRRTRAMAAVKRLFTLDRSIWTRQAMALRAAFDDRLSVADRALVDAFCDQRSLGVRWAYLRRYGFVYQRRQYPFVASLLYLVGRYRVR